MYAGDETQWDDEVSLHGPDTFYNWEQDNIPLVQLANRTAWLYAKATGQSMAGNNLSYGGPGNAAAGALGASVDFSNGVVLTLSSTADRTKGIYSDLSRLLTNVPKTLKYPLTIEICKFGDLGALNLHGITCEGSGVLEIVNRNAGVAHGGLSGTTAAARTEIRSVGLTSGVGTALANNDARAGKTIAKLDRAMPLEFSSHQLWADISGASSVKGPNVYSKTGWNASSRCFLIQHPVTSSKSPAISLHLASGTSTIDFIGDGVPTFSSNVFTSSAMDLSVSSSDAVPASRSGYHTDGLHEDTRNYTAWAADGNIHAAAYGSYFSKISIRDCHGEYIKLKNIMVDSGEGNSKFSDDVANAYHESSNGFSIENSEVILEGTASVRNKYTGYSICNSKVKFRKGAIAYRNYPLVAGGSRVSSDTSNYETGDPKLAHGVGLYCRNSVVLFDTENDSTSPAGSFYTSSVAPGYYPYYFGYNGVGVYAKNSHIGGGTLGTVFTPGEDSQTSKVITSNNTKGGFLLENSTFTYKGIPWSYLNEGHGFYAAGSTVKTTGLISEYNELDGLHLINSSYLYGFGGKEIGATLRSNGQRLARGSRTGTVHTCSNGRHNIKVSKSSSFTPEKFVYMDSTYGEIGGNGTNKTMETSGGGWTYWHSTPMVSVDGNSFAEFLSFGASVPHDATYAASSAPIRGAAASITNGSTATFIGTSALNTVAYRNASLSIADVGRRLDLLNSKASFYAGNHSTLRMSGPTKISGLGVGVLGENNSNVEFGPVVDEHKHIDVINYDLSTGTAAAGHSKIDVHALRSCVVVNKNSTLKMEDLGGSATAGTGPGFNDASSVDSLKEIDSLATACTSGGYFQFHPNGYTDMILSSTFLGSTNIGAAASTRTGNLGAQTGTSTGGMCVRAVGNSIVDVNRVNFPMGANPSAVSGVYYNLEGSGGEHATGYAGPNGNGNTPHSEQRFGGSQIYIWNLADTSRIHAANLLVSGVTPSSIGGGTGANYHGPAGKWFNGVGLDYYGSDGAAGFSATDVTLASYENNGPFRLMFGTRGVVKSYFDLSGNTVSSLGYQADKALSSAGGSPIDQINGQGYMVQVSSVSSLTHSDSTYAGQYENAVYGDAVFGAYSGTSSIPENYIGSQGNGLVSVPVIHGEWQGYMRNFLDESAANTFANAKHSANERVGFVSIYNSNIDPMRGGEGRDSFDQPVTFGKGVRSLNLFDLDRLV
mgnify:CR=1 FL=1